MWGWMTTQGLCEQNEHAIFPMLIKLYHQGEPSGFLPFTHTGVTASPPSSSIQMNEEAAISPAPTPPVSRATAHPFPLCHFECGVSPICLVILSAITCSPHVTVAHMHTLCPPPFISSMYLHPKHAISGAQLLVFHLHLVISRSIQVQPLGMY